MVSEPSYKALTSGLRTLSRKWPNAEQLSGMFDALEQQDDRNSAIIAASGVEVMLRMAIQIQLASRTPEEFDFLFGENGPFGGFGQKVHTSYGMGIIGIQTKKLLQIIRLVRNTFAHFWGRIDFETKEISDACLILTPFDIFQVSSIKPEYGRTLTAKSAYLTSCTLIALNLLKHVRQSGSSEPYTLP